MKRITSILLLLATILSSGLLTACGHECTLADGWRNDATSHWHACTDSDCTKKADLANHTWDKGEVTKRATQEAAGVRTYTCTECQYKKTQSFAFQGLSEDEWYEALSQDMFVNFTYTERTSVKISGSEVVTTTVYEFENGGKARVSETALGETETSMIPADSITMYRNALWAYCSMMADYEDYYYDSRTKSYLLKGVFTHPVYNVPVDSASIKFKDGKLSEITFTCKITEDGTIYYVSSTITLSNYDTTKIK